MNLNTRFEGHNGLIHQVVKFDNFLKLDLSTDNQELSEIDLNDEKSFTDYIFKQIEKSGNQVAIGGYLEKRSLYSRSELFEGEEFRTIHLGIDIWAPAGTPVYAPIDGTVHSFANRNVHGDYGPVIILKHEVDGFIFHTLYGHLSLDSLDNIQIGKSFGSGQPLAKMGGYHENFHWPPHLHFQVIVDMNGLEGDYPGVAKASEIEYYSNNCPDPSIFIFE